MNPTRSEFSTIFYAIYKNQSNHNYYLSYPFAVRPSERSFVLQCGPGRGWPARVSKIPARFAGVWPGKDGGRV
jgi:hypothetical protein